MSFIRRIQKFIQAQGLIERGDTVLVGVSGGADSTALLCVLHSLQSELGLKLIVAHFNHDLRLGAKSDENFVRKLSQKLNLKFVSKTWIHQVSSTKSASEDAARKKRFEFFFDTAKFFKADCIALAHNLDDVAETVMLRMIRGSGLSGLRAILPKRKMNGFWVVRPLIKVNRVEIEDFLRHIKQSFRIDPTNHEDKYLRNKVRLELLPLIERHYNPQIKESLSHLAESIVYDYDYLEKNARRVFLKLQISVSGNKLSFKMKKLMSQATSMRRMLIRMAVVQLKGNLNRITLGHMLEVEELLENRPLGSVVNWPDKMVFVKEAEWLRIYKKN